MAEQWRLQCVECERDYPGLDLRYRCECGGTLDVIHDFTGREISTELFDSRRGSNNPMDRSGVWRFRELVLPLSPEFVVTRGEGNTTLYDHPKVAAYTGLDRLRLKHEGENPTGSFKDRGMTAAVSMAKQLGMTAVACASTGNTSASMASYAAFAGMDAYVFIPEGKIAYGKLCQALAYNGRTIQIRGDFDEAMTLVQQVCDSEGIYLVNSVNPFRIEGQKAIVLEMLQDMDWEVPDWFVMPGGNLGNNTALSKALLEAYDLGLINKLPRLAVIQASGANPLYTAFQAGADSFEPVASKTLATAIQIGNPVSFTKSMRGVRRLNGVVEQVTDQQILDAKAQVDAAGIGAEPASCATVAGIKKLVAAGVIKSDENVCGVLTGHLLKDPDIVVNYHRGTLEGIDSTYPNPPTVCDATLSAVLSVLHS